MKPFVLKKVPGIFLIKSLTSGLFLFLFISVFAQTPVKINYQAILRDSDNKLITDSPVGMRFSILQGAPDGTAVYVETQQPATNDNGLITVEIGSGTVVSGDLSAIDWSAGPYFLKTEADPAGGTDYTITGTSQIVSVPYAFYARKAGNVFSGDYNDLSNAPVNVSAFTNDAGYLTVETDGDTTNELQLLSISGDTLFLSNGGFVKLPPDGDFIKSGHFVTTLDSVGIGTETPGSILEVHGPIWQTGTANSVILGQHAGENLTIPTATGNILIGQLAGTNSTMAYYNTAIGYKSLESNKTGSHNTAVGSNTLNKNTASFNTAVGSGALMTNTTGNSNTSLGYNSMRKNTTGSHNTAIGRDALTNNTEGTWNTAVGSGGLMMNTTGNNNTSGGHDALRKNTTGHDNTALGYQSLFSNTTGLYNTAVGSDALLQNTASSNTALGYQSLYANTEGVRNTASGYRSLYGNTIGSWNTATGYRALAANTTGNNNTATGYFALGLNTEGHDNTAHGNWALYFNTTGYNNTAVGNYALYKNNTGNDNTAVGDSSLYNNKGIQNTAVGRSALVSNTSGKFNTAVGSYALHKNTISGENTAVGHQALYNYNTSMNNGGFNTAVGYGALSNLKAGNFNLAIGNLAGSDIDFAGYTISIGAFAQVTASYQARIGNILINSIGGYAAWSNLSDGRFKTEVKSAVPGLAFIMKLRPVMYHLDIDKLATFLKIPDDARNRVQEQKRAQTVETGFIAQEVEKAAREVDFDFNGIDPPKNDHDYYNLRYAEFVVPLVKAVQEQQAEIEALKKQNQLLQQQIDALKNRQ